ncbi:B12-binding domain-containing radical SAM protein [Candidatus Daviesbacteria bacterium]|nr:B12-binding domain-containing radical SAM protein [Candidatus Daviesbacteria bacterium]
MEKIHDIPVCFIIPPSTFLADERVFPFLGPLKVAAELKKNGNKVEVLDLSGYGNFEEIVEQYVKETDIKNFALTATTPQIPAAAKIVNKLREGAPEGKIILGGPHTTLTYTGMTEDLKAGRLSRGTLAYRQLEGLFDKLVVGDGELAIFRALDPECKLKTIDAGNLKSPLFMQKGTLENFEFPARDLIDLDSYHYYIDGHRAFSVIAQLGCPFECGFCGGRDSQVFRVARSRSINHVISEIEYEVGKSRERGNPYSAAMFYDDELNISPKNLENLCQELILMQERLGVEMRFRGFVKAELFTPTQAKLMYDAGFRMLLSGVESGSDEMLKTMKKHTTSLINSICLNYAKDAGLKFKALMSIGHPGESEKTVRESVDWVLKNKPDDVDWTIITQYPGSPYFDKSIYDDQEQAWVYVETKTGHKLWSRAIDYTVEAEYYKGVPGDYTSYVWTKYLSSERLVELRDGAEQVTRNALKLPPITEAAVLQFEHSMGQNLPRNILRVSSIV